MTGWTETETQQALDLWKQGYSAGRIAQKLETKSRSAILGKLNRLGALRGERPKLPAKERTRKNKKTHVEANPIVTRLPKRNTIVAHRRSRRLAQQRRMGRPKRETVIIPITKRKSIMNLKPDMCRWPTTGNTGIDTRFCGHAVTSGSSYCLAHSELSKRDSDHIVVEKM